MMATAWVSTHQPPEDENLVLKDNHGVLIIEFAKESKGIKVKQDHFTAMK